MSPAKQTRRTFLQSSAALAAGSAVPYWFTGEKAQAFEFLAPSDRPLIGQIGCGGQGNSITGRARRFGDVVAVCDVDSQQVQKANQNLAGGKAKVYEDYRKLLEDDKINVVMIGTPDHWHSKIAIEAMQAGKDVYCEKPLTLTIEEGQQILKVLNETKRVFQVGTQQRSNHNKVFLHAAALCREGRLGKIKRVAVAIGGGDAGGPFKKEAAPDHLNWDMWLGQTPKVEYIKQRCHYQFRWWYEYSGGKMTDWGAHHIDVAHWCLGADDTGPVSFEGSASHPVPFKDGYPTQDDRYNTATDFRVVAKFKDGVELIIAKAYNEGSVNMGNGVYIEGDKGRIQVDRGRLRGKPAEELKDNPLPEEAILKLYKGNQPKEHVENFFECVKTRKEPVSDVATHHRAMTTCHLANICIRLGRKLQWDPEKELIIGDEEARAFQRRPQRAGYQIKV